VKKASSDSHKALDIEKASGQRVGASRAGTVSAVHTSDDNSCGKYVKVSHDGDWETLYCRLSSVSVTDGQDVARDEKIGEMGSTGEGSETFLHFEIRYKGGRQSIPGWTGQGLVEGAGIPKSYYDDSSGGDGGDGGTGSLEKRSVGYFQRFGGEDTSYGPADVPYDDLSHLNVFSLEPQSDGSVVLKDSYQDDLLTDFSSYNDDTTTFMLTVYGDETTFSDAAATSTRRSRFATQAVDHVVNYGFDGLDIDWEFPDGSHRSSEPEDFVKLIQACRDELDSRVGTSAELSVAVSAAPSKIDTYNVADFEPYVDHVNVMTYNYHGDWSNDTNFNSPLDEPDDDPDNQDDWSASYTMEYWADKPISKAKLVMGVPFYGYAYYGVAGTNKGLFQDYSSAEAVLYDDIDPANYSQYWHHDSDVPWLYSWSDDTFVSWVNEASVANKAEWVMENDFGGAFCWELGHNTDNSLITEMASELSESEPAVDKPPMEWVSADDSNYEKADRENDHPIKWYVIHVAEGSYQGTIDWFQNPDSNVATHYVIENSTSPDATQMVDESDICWHTGNAAYNDTTLGVEHEGYTDETIWYEEVYERSAEIAQWACLEYGIPLEVRRFDVAPCTESDGDGGVLGHVQVPDPDDCSRNGHTDPGSTWNWGLFEAYLRRNQLDHNDHLATQTDVAVRDAPGGSQIDTAPEGTTGTVVDDAVDSDGNVWYEVAYDDGVSNGWSHGDYLLYARFDMDHVTESEGVTVRDGPGTSYNAIDTASSGEGGQVRDGPVFGDEYTWWKVEWYGDTSTGWVAGWYLRQDY
jgi:chitinase